MTNPVDGRVRCAVVRGLIREERRPRIDNRIRPCQVSHEEGVGFASRTSDRTLLGLYCVGPLVVRRIRELYGPYHPAHPRPSFRADDV